MGVGSFTRRLRNVRPIIWPVTSWTITLLCFGLVDLYTHTEPDLSSLTFRATVTFLVILGLIAPYIAMVGYFSSYFYHVKTIRNKKISLGRIIALYISLILLTANLTFTLNLHFTKPTHDLAPFHGIQSPWQDPVAGRMDMLEWNRLVLSVIDSIHFSIVTVATIGYGDTYPTQWFSKLLVDFEILLGVGITVFMIGVFFSGIQDKADG